MHTMDDMNARRPAPTRRNDNAAQQEIRRAAHAQVPAGAHARHAQGSAPRTARTAAGAGAAGAAPNAPYRTGSAATRTSRAAAPHRRSPKKAIVIAVAAALVAAVAVGGTIAWLTDTTQTEENVFTPSKVSTAIDEKTDGGVKSDVSVTNTGTTDAFIRAQVQVNWANEAGDIYGGIAAPMRGTDYEIVFNTVADDAGNAWFEGSDGYGYWSGKVAPGASTGILISSLTPKGRPEGLPDGYSLDVRIIASGIQAAGTGEGGDGHPEAKAPVEQAWPAVVRSDDGNRISAAPAE